MLHCFGQLTKVVAVHEVKFVAVLAGLYRACTMIILELTGSSLTSLCFVTADAGVLADLLFPRTRDLRQFAIALRALENFTSFEKTFVAATFQAIFFAWVWIVFQEILALLADPAHLNSGRYSKAPTVGCTWAATA